MLIYTIISRNEKNARKIGRAKTEISRNTLAPPSRGTQNTIQHNNIYGNDQSHFRENLSNYVIYLLHVR